MFNIKSFIVICLCPYWTFTSDYDIKIINSINHFPTDYEVDDPLSYSFEDKHDEKDEFFEVQIKKNLELTMTTIETIQQDLKMVKQVIDKIATSFAVNDEDHNVLDVKCSNNRLPESCSEVKECRSDIYNIMIPNYNNRLLAVSCDLSTDNGGWTVIQRRKDGFVNFDRNWTEYVKGFGNLKNEFFIGLEKLHALTTQQPQELYIQLENFEGVERYAKYTRFEIASAENDYKLTVDGYSGNAGDSLSSHSGQKFSTWDRDNDMSAFNCAKDYEGAWWYSACHMSNLNGKYKKGTLSNSGQGIIWSTFGYIHPLKFSQMIQRRTSSGTFPYYTFPLKFSQMMIRRHIE